MRFSVGSLVRVRGREWVVLPESQEDLLILRPLGGTDDEITGIYLPLEQVEPATFGLPDPSQLGDYRSCRLLRDAVRLSFRSGAGPFRSFGRIAVEPRPYQLVPLLMALKLDPVRLLIADDVGIGKTVEACLIARELLDRGEIQRLAVLCPPHLAEQWQKELKEKFYLDAELVLPSTAARLERNLGLGQSLFEVYPFVVVSTDFIKSDRRRNEFLRTCPEFVIVDEAHTCVDATQGRGGRHQRFELLKGVASHHNRHLVLVTATPHSGNEDAFRSLLSMLNPDFKDLPADLTGKQNEHYRRKLAAHFVQRRRADIRHYLQQDTPFPERYDTDATYRLTSDYKKLFERVLNYVRESVSVSGENRHRQRVRWWSALALLRSLASSPAAAVATLRNRSALADAVDIDEVEEMGRRTVLDLEEEEFVDFAPGGDPGGDDNEAHRTSRQLLEMARQAEKLYGSKDAKLLKAIDMVKQLVEEGYRPILFCRYIETAEYVAEYMRSCLPSDVEVAAVTGLLSPAEREERIWQLSQHQKRVLVATDCLSEGINLQEYFDSVIHYDLSWNPTRHEQREGRVDRYGQPRDKVRVITYYGIDNRIDGIVLDVLLRKHKQIRNSLGISVPVPVDTNAVVEAILEGLLLRGKPIHSEYEQLSFEFATPIKEELFARWENVSAKEKISRTMFAQHSIKVEEVAQELAAVQQAIGSGVDVEAFTKEALEACGVPVIGDDPMTIKLSGAPRALKEVLGYEKDLMASFKMPVKDGVTYLNRMHPLVESLANYIIDTALDPLGEAVACRCGVIRTKMVDIRTTLLIVRFRYHIVTMREQVEVPLLAEECRVMAFTGSPQNASWLEEAEAEKLLAAVPVANIHSGQARSLLRGIIENFPVLQPYLEETARLRGAELLEAHQRVRAAAKHSRVSYRVRPHLPPDVIGLYLYLPIN